MQMNQYSIQSDSLNIHYIIAANKLSANASVIVEHTNNNIHLLHVHLDVCTFSIFNYVPSNRTCNQQVSSQS